MEIEPFATERFFARHEFTAQYLLCASDCESMTVSELLQMANEPMDTVGRVWLGYTQTQGAPALRGRIARQYERTAAEEVLVLAAPEEGIFLVMHALLEPGDEVIVLTPCYDSLANLPAHLNCGVKRWALVEAEEPPTGPGGWRLDLDALAALLSKRTRLVVVNFPHNPTGCLASAAEWRSIVALAARHGTWLFSDEMYRGLEQEAGDRLPAACDLYERAVTLGGLSKAYGLPGLRCGWLALKDEALRERILRWKDYTTICAAAPCEVLAAVALGIAAPLLERSRRIVRANLLLADAFFERRRAVFRWNRPRAGSVALVGVREQAATAFCERLLRAAGVLLLPGPCLGAGDRHVRFGLGRLNFPAALAQLDHYLG